ncbi:MAG: permease [Candidatus Dormiibacterota bacterium]
MTSGLREAGDMFWETLWALVLGFALSGAIQAVVPRRGIRQLLGDTSPLSLLRATGFGAASSSCSYASAAMAKSLFSEGANFVTAIVFMLASTNLVIELGIVLAVLIGWQFTGSEIFGGLLMILLFVLLARATLPQPLIERARDRLRASATYIELEAAAPWGVRVRSGEVWRAAARYAIADLRMLRKEIVGGFLVAGFLAALVPDQAWQALFLSGHGLASSLENAAIGPLIAVLSFVCSVGNVPLAAALWKGGISFGGVSSFLYADLISFPLLLIYRKYYGGRLTLRLLATLWLVMSAAGLTTQYLFGALGGIPSTRPHQIALHALGWNWTTGLDLVAVAALAGCFVLARQGRSTAQRGAYAVDPVCGMQIERGTAPARAEHQGQPLYFCSDRCLDRFQRNPERFIKVPSVPMAPPPSPARDPVCGMPVDPARAAAKVERSGQDFYFCSPQCRDRFLRDPSRYNPEQPAASKLAPIPGQVDPVCGMVVDPNRVVAASEYQGQQFGFCSVQCRDRFQDHPDLFASMRSLPLPADQPEFPIDPICGMSVDPDDPGATLDLPEGTVYFCCQPCADTYAADRLTSASGAGELSSDQR